MKNIINAGILGTGHAHAIGKLRTIQSSSEYKLVGVCEPNDDLRKKRQNEESFKRVNFMSKKDLLSDESIRIIAIEGEVKENLDYGIDAVEAGKHIHLDKPAGTDFSKFQKVVNKAKSKNLILQMGYQFRYNPGFELAMKAVKEGWLGDIFSIHGSIGSSISPGSRKGLAFHPGGMMFELSCHLIDILVSILGRPQKVTPFLRHDAEIDDKLADNTMAVFEFDKAIAMIESAAMEVQAGKRRQFEICGTKGTLIVQPLEPPSVRLCLSEKHGDYQAGWQSVSVPNIPRYVKDFEDLACCIRDEKEPSYSFEHDLTVQETILRACGCLI